MFLVRYPKSWCSTMSRNYDGRGQDPYWHTKGRGRGSPQEADRGDKRSRDTPGDTEREQLAQRSRQMTQAIMMNEAADTDENIDINQVSHIYGKGSVTMPMHLWERNCVEWMTRIVEDEAMGNIKNAEIKWDYHTQKGITFYVDVMKVEHEREVMETLIDTSNKVFNTLKDERWNFPDSKWNWNWNVTMKFPQRVVVNDDDVKVECKDEDDKWQKQRDDWRASRWDEHGRSGAAASTDDNWQGGGWKHNRRDWKDEDYDPKSIEEMKYSDKQKAWKWYRPGKDLEASPAPIYNRAYRTDHRHDEERAEKWIQMTKEERTSHNIDPEMEKELLITGMRKLMRNDDSHQRQLDFHKDQIALAQKKQQESTLKLHGFFQGWPSIDNRKAAVMYMLEYFGMPERDIVDISDLDANGSLPPTVFLQFRNPQRKKFWLKSLWRKEYSDGFVIQGSKEDETLYLTCSDMDAPIDRAEGDVKRAITAILHRSLNTDDKKIHNRFTKVWNPELKVTWDNDLILETCLIGGEYNINVKSGQFVKLLVDDLLTEVFLKAAPRSIKYDYDAEQDDTVRKAMVGSFHSLFPYNINICPVNQFIGDPVKNWKERIDKIESSKKGSGRKGSEKGKGSGRGRGRGKGKGGEKGGKDNFATPGHAAAVDDS